jgi:hypothetical protein
VISEAAEVAGVGVEGGVMDDKSPLRNVDGSSPTPSGVGDEGRVMDDKSFILDVDGSSVRTGSFVALESTGVDLHIGNTTTNCTAIYSGVIVEGRVMGDKSPIKYVDGSSRCASGVGLEGAGVDLDVCLIRINCTSMRRILAILED